MYRIAMIVVMGGLLLGASRCNKDENDGGEQPMEGGGSSGAGGSSAGGGSSGSGSHDPAGGSGGKGGGPISGGSGSGGSSSGSGGSSSGGTAGSKPPPSDAPRCGGIAARPCPGRGSCVDDPSDSCDPKNGGADCGGICQCSAVGRCAPSLPDWNSSPDVCDCVAPDAGGAGDPGSDAGSGVECGSNTCAAGETCCNPSCGICTKPGEGCTKQLCPPPTDPDPTPVHCGGFAGLPCPGSGECVDDPSDSCDPQNGGADCGGICTCMGPATVLCIQGSEWSSDPHVCACTPIAGGGGGSGQQCGKTTCPADQTCCNASCGICAPKGGACIQIACF